MTALLASMSGYKTYIASGLGIIVILAVHFLGVTIPGVTLDSNNWMTDIWSLVLVITGRSAIATVATP